jgi:hypothetical protein
MSAKVEEALQYMTPHDVIILHLFDNVAYMSRSEEGGDLPIRQYGNGEFHVEGDLVLASKDRLYMFFKNALPLLKLLEGLRVVFLTPLPVTYRKDAARLTITRRTDSTTGSRLASARA